MNQREKLETAVAALRDIVALGGSAAAIAKEALGAIKVVGRSAWSPPSVEDVDQYLRERVASGAEINFTADQWVNHYTAVGWRVGKNPMRDWRAAVRTWEKATERTPQTPVRRSIGNRLLPEDCVSAEAFEDWWKRQSQFPKTEQMRFYAHSVRHACRGDYDKIFKAFEITAKTGKMLNIPPKSEDAASEDLRRLR